MTANSLESHDSHMNLFVLSSLEHIAQYDIEHKSLSSSSCSIIFVSSVFIIVLLFISECSFALDDESVLLSYGKNFIWKKHILEVILFTLSELLSSK